MRENFLKDSVVNKEKNYNNLLAQENKLRQSQLANEKELKAALSPNLISVNVCQRYFLPCPYIVT